MGHLALLILRSKSLPTQSRMHNGQPGPLVKTPPTLQLIEVSVAPHLPPYIVHIAGVRKSRSQHDSLQISRPSKVRLEELETALVEPCKEDTFQVAVADDTRGLRLQEARKFRVVEVFEAEGDAVAEVEVMGFHDVAPVAGDEEGE